MFSLPPGTDNINLHLFRTEIVSPHTKTGINILITPRAQINSSTAGKDQLIQYKVKVLLTSVKFRALKLTLIV